MTIQQEIEEIQKLHDEYRTHRFDEGNPVGLINMFHNWHSRSTVLFSRYIPESNQDLQRFKAIESGNSYVLASQFDGIESAFCLLVDKVKRSVSAMLEQLVQEGKDIESTIRYKEPPSNVQRMFDVYSVGREADYQIWKNKCIRLLELHFKNDSSCDIFKGASQRFNDKWNNPKFMKEMLGVLVACAEIPQTNEGTNIRTPEVVTPGLTINVNQTQSQSMALVIFLDSIKDEIPGKHLKELQQIAKEEQDPAKAKSRIMNIVKSFGSDVLSNILANIITNPSIWSQM